LSKAGWQCEARADKDQGVHFTIYRAKREGGKALHDIPAAKIKGRDSDLCSD
jgi:hypothetical protein